MIKLNIIRWLKTLKLCLLVSSVLFLTAALIIFVNYFVSYTTYANNFVMIIGAYESSIIDNLVVSGFSMRWLYTIVYSLLCLLFLICFILFISLIYMDRYCIFKCRKTDSLNLIIYVGIFVILSLLVLDDPAIQSLDLVVTQLTPQTLVICYDFTVVDQLVNFIINQNGIIFIVLLSFLNFAAFWTYFFRLARVIQHRYF